MNKVWLQIFAVMIGGSLVKSVIQHPYVWVGIDLVVLGIIYLVLRRYAMIDMKNSMTFLGGLTVVSILTDLGMINDVTGLAITLALVGWMMFGRSGKGKPPSLRHKWNK